MRYRGSLLLSLSLCALPPALCAKVQEAPKYTAEEYKAFQEATTATDPPKRLDLILTFIKDRPQSALRQHVIAAYQKALTDLQSSQSWPQLVEAGDRYLAIMPDDIYTISMLATAHQKLNHNKEFVVYGERVFATNPSDNLAYYLAKAYLDLKNDAKFFEYGDKVATMMPNNHEILIELTTKSVAAKKSAQAVKYARQCIKAMQETPKPPETPDKTWRDYQSFVFATCYAVVGNSAYDRQDYAGAIANLESSLKYSPKNQVAYYYMAQSYWQQGKIDLAMKNFAKAYLIKGSVSAAAKQHLDNLYKTTHQQSLVGQERVIEKARSELQH